jgi:hypothetical protein
LHTHANQIEHHIAPWIAILQEESLMTDNMSEISQSQKERLSFVDLRLRFAGEVRRIDLVDRFGLQSAAATRDFALYKQMAPDNIIYNGSGKFYERGAAFKPLYNFDIDRILIWISQGLGYGAPSQLSPVVPFEAPHICKNVDAEILSAVSRSIFLRKVVSIEYSTLEQGITKREFVPFALADTEYGWVVRGFDRLTGQFMSFDLARISNADIISGEITEEETQIKDILWNRHVELELVPHPKNVRQPETVAKEYNMTDGVLKVWVRDPLAAYTLRRWNVDCSEKHTLRGNEYQLWLRNRQTLYGVKNLSIAPGYDSANRS